MITFLNSHSDQLVGYIGGFISGFIVFAIYALWWITRN